MYNLPRDTLGEDTQAPMSELVQSKFPISGAYELVEPVCSGLLWNIGQSSPVE